MKTLFYFDSRAQSATIFVDEDGAMVSYIHENDGDWRPEYMDFIVEYFGGKMESIDVDDQDYDDDWEKYSGEDIDDTMNRLRPFIFSAIKKYNENS